MLQIDSYKHVLMCSFLYRLINRQHITIAKNFLVHYKNYILFLLFHWIHFYYVILLVHLFNMSSLHQQLTSPALLLSSVYYSTSLKTRKDTVDEILLHHENVCFSSRIPEEQGGQKPISLQE